MNEEKPFDIGTLDVAALKKNLDELGVKYAGNTGKVKLVELLEKALAANREAETVAATADIEPVINVVVSAEADAAPEATLVDVLVQDPAAVDVPDAQASVIAAEGELSKSTSEDAGPELEEILVVRSKADCFYRCGRRFTPEPETLKQSDFSAEQWQRLKDDPDLDVGHG